MGTLQATPNVDNYKDAKQKVNALPAGPIKNAEQAKLDTVVVPVDNSDFAEAITEEIKNVKLTDDVTVNAQVKPAAGVTIDGDGKELKFGTDTGVGATTAEGLYIAEEGITIKNLVIKDPLHGDNGIEIYKSVTLENVTVKGAKKAGIYVNHTGTDEMVVNFKNIITDNNGPDENWKAGIGLRALNAGATLTVNFSGTKNFGELTVLPGTETAHGTKPGAAVYSDNAAKASVDASGVNYTDDKYAGGGNAGTIQVNGLTAYIGAYNKDNWK